MTFISYAQNAEDVMLWRALKAVKNGFYIDVGANDPEYDSVTKVFYDAGWSGINIEPLRDHYDDLVRRRPRDINLQCAAGAEVGVTELWECDIRGWASASSAVISQHQAKGYEGIFRTVQVRTLMDICAEHAPGEIHFIKIDVEGFEADVVAGLDLHQVRPWVLVIEAVEPSTGANVYESWEPSILLANYSLAYADGLNRFYVSHEHAELLVHFRYPPSVLDNYIRLRQYNLERQLKQAELAVQQAELRTQQANRNAESLQQTLDALVSSRSWRITAPLRSTLTSLRRLRALFRQEP